MDDEKAYEILEENGFFMQLLEDFMKRFSECLTNSVEETWIGLLSRYFVLEEVQPRRKWTWDGEGSSHCFSCDEPPAWHRSLSANEISALNVSRPREPVLCHYYVDQPTDTFRKDFWTEASFAISFSLLYGTWIEHSYEKKITHHANWVIDGEWYKESRSPDGKDSRLANAVSESWSRLNAISRLSTYVIETCDYVFPSGLCATTSFRENYLIK